MCIGEPNISKEFSAKIHINLSELGFNPDA